MSPARRTVRPAPWRAPFAWPLSAPLLVALLAGPALAQAPAPSPAPTPSPAPVAPPAPVRPGESRATFSDWELRCEGAGEAERCALYQNVADEGRSDINLVVVVLKLADPKSAERKPVLRVIAPLGVLLPRGLGLTIEGADAAGAPAKRDIGSTGFVKCLPNGCLADVFMDEGLINEFRRGRVATFYIFQTPEEGFGLPLNLAGFEAGFASLK